MINEVGPCTHQANRTTEDRYQGAASCQATHRRGVSAAEKRKNFEAGYPVPFLLRI